MHATTEQVIKFPGSEWVVLLGQSDIVDFDPWQTQTISVIYEEYPGEEKLLQDLRDHGWTPLGVSELITTVAVYDALTELGPPATSLRSRYLKIRNSEREAKLKKAKQLEGWLEKAVTIHNEPVGAQVSSVTYAGTLLTDLDTRLRSLRFYPTLSLGRYGISIGVELLLPGFFYEKIACRRN